MNRLLKNYIYNIIYQVFLLIVPVITAPYLARVLGATQLGVYGYINSITSIVTTIGLLGLNTYGIRQIAYYQDDQNKCSNIFWEIMFARFMLLFVTSIFYLIGTFNSEYKELFLIQYLLVISLFCDVSWFMIGLEDMGIIVFRNFIAKLLTVLGIFIFVKEKSDLWVYLALFSIITLLTIISLYPYVRKYISWHRIKMRDVINHFIPSLLLFLPQVATLLYLQVDKIMLKFMTNDTNQIAFYDQADKIIQIPLALITAIGMVMMPRLASEFNKKNYDNISNYLNKILMFVLFLSFPMMFGIATISPTLIPWYLGNEFLPVIPAIMIISPLIILNSLNSISGSQYFTATNQTKILTFAYITAMFINILINILLIPKFGYKGAAIATFVSSLLSVIIQYYYMTKQIDMSSTFFKSYKYFFSAVFMGTLVFIIGKQLQSTFITTIIQIVTGTLIYFLILFVLKDEMVTIITTEAKKYMKSKR